MSRMGKATKTAELVLVGALVVSAPVSDIFATTSYAASAQAGAEKNNLFVEEMPGRLVFGNVSFADPAANKITVAKTNVIIPLYEGVDHKYDLTAKIDISINDKLVVFTDARPIIDRTAGRVLAPVRIVAENLGYQVIWDGKTQEVTFKTADTTAILTIGSTRAILNGDIITMDTAPIITNGRTMVPVRFIAEAFSCDVSWDSALKVVRIQTGGTGNPVDEDGLYNGLVNIGNTGVDDGLNGGENTVQDDPGMVDGGKDPGSIW